MEENAGGWILEGYVFHIWNDIAKKHFVSYVIAMVSGLSEIHTCANAGVNSGLLKGSRFMIKLYQLCRLYLCVYSFSRKAGIYPGTENAGSAFLPLLFCGTWHFMVAISFASQA